MIVVLRDCRMVFVAQTRDEAAETVLKAVKATGQPYQVVYAADGEVTEVSLGETKYGFVNLPSASEWKQW